MLKLHGLLKEARQCDNEKILVLSNDVVADAEKTGMTVCDYVKETKRINPQFEDVYLVHDTSNFKEFEEGETYEEEEEETYPTTVDEWMQYNGLSWSDFI